ncbi:MAG: HAD-IIA family hydrolase [Clostridia bacterium]|nr:HAD-IIA family hydrolase [Clostridia bacterium]
MSDLRKKKLFLLDMDGTLFLDNQLYEGVHEFLDYIKSVGGKYIFVTNNSSKSVDKYIEKLASLGIESQAEDFLTSTNATVLYLNKKNYNKIYAFGTQPFKEQLRDANLPITDKLEDDIDCLCMGFDTELTFQKLEDACILLNRGVDYVATNPDWVCPTWYGSVPDCGSISQILCTATGRMPKFIGKPQPEMALLAMEQNGFSHEETAVIGDRLYTDIACGVNAGVSTIFVLSGEGTMEDVQKSDKKPEFIYENVLELYKYLVKEQNND